MPSYDWAGTLEFERDAPEMRDPAIFAVEALSGGLDGPRNDERPENDILALLGLATAASR
jgi:hypothetical protein